MPSQNPRGVRGEEQGVGQESVTDGRGDGAGPREPFFMKAEMTLYKTGT